MPHFIIDCSENITNQKSPEEIMQAVYDAAEATGLFAPNDIKVRLRPYQYFKLGKNKKDFIHIFGNLMEGRDTEQKADLSQKIIERLNGMFPDISILSINIREFERATYSNKALIHPLNTTNDRHFTKEHRISEAIRVSVIRHTKNYEAMLGFYRDRLGMSIKETWDEPDNRGTLLSIGEQASNVLIEVIQLKDQGIPGVKPVIKPENVMLSIEVPAVDAWHDQLMEGGVTIARGLEDASWGQRSFGIDDPDGLRIWYYQDFNPK